jgi:plastocyanin
MLLTLLSSTSGPLAITTHVNGLLDKVIDKVTGKDDGDDDKGSDDDDDKGSDDDDDKGSDDDDDKGSDGESNNESSDDKNGKDSNDGDNDKSGEQKDDSNSGNVGKISTVFSGTSLDQRDNAVMYVQIKSTNNETRFVPDEVTLSPGSKIIWMNSDSLDHRITVGSGSDSEYSLLNSLLWPGGIVEHEFDSEGTFFYTDLENPEAKGTITVLD